MSPFGKPDQHGAALQIQYRLVLMDGCEGYGQHMLTVHV
jgi:hypothetical protein